MTTKKIIIPNLSTPAGACLTAKNWEALGISCVSYDAASLLIKPGLSYLKSLPDWQRYTGWQGEWILDATMLRFNTTGESLLRSPFDGSTIRYTLQDLVDVIVHLKPHHVLLPIGFEADDAIWAQMCSHSIIHIPEAEKTIYEKRLNSTSRIQINHYIITDLPAADAYNGLVYFQRDTIDLKDKAYAMDFNLISSDCQCPTCTQKFTRAYLHHLFEHTPLLCQRLLIQHNVCATLLEK